MQTTPPPSNPTGSNYRETYAYLCGLLPPLVAASRAANDPMEQRRCRAQAASMARQSDAALRSLHRIQALREKQLAQTHPAAMERAGYWFREATVPEPAPEPAPAEPPAQAELTEAEKYAVIYPDRAARIRACRGLPARLDFGPPEPEIVEALVSGTSPILRELDQRREVVAGSAPSSLKSKV